MPTAIFYGSSDDNFCVEGDFSDEWGAFDRPRRVRTDTGLVIEGAYAPKGYGAKWRIRVVGDVPPNHEVKHEPATDEDDNYSDRLSVTGPFKFVRPIRSRDELIETLKGVSWADLYTEQLQQVVDELEI